MGYKKVDDLNPDTVISLGGFNKKTNKKNPTEIEGYYKGSRPVPDQKKKSGLSYIHVFQVSTGGEVGVWGKTDLDKKILQGKKGYMTKIECTGTKPTPNGPMYTFNVYQDDTNTIEVDISAPQSESYNDEPESAYSYEADDQEEQEAPEPVLAAKPARKSLSDVLKTRVK